MDNNDQSGREGSPSKPPAKRRVSRHPHVLNTPVVPDTSFIDSTFAPSGGDYGSAAPGSGVINYFQTGETAQTGRFENADLGPAAVSFHHARQWPTPAANTPKDGLPESYRFGSFANPFNAGGAATEMGTPARKKSAATKPPGTESSDPDSSSITAAGTKSAGNRLSVNVASGTPSGIQPSPAATKLSDKNLSDNKSASGKSTAATKATVGTKSTASTKATGTKSAASKAEDTTSSKLNPPVRISQSCTPCRRRKARCVKVEGQDRCEHCQKMDKDCIYEPTSKKITNLPTGEDESASPANKKVRFAANTKKAASKANRKSRQPQDETADEIADDTGMANNTAVSDTSASAATAPDHILEHEGDSDVEMTEPDTQAPQEPTVDAPAAHAPSAGLGFFDNSGGFAQYEQTAANDPSSINFNSGGFAQYEQTAANDPSSINYNPYGIDEVNLDNYGPPLNSAGELLDQLEYERIAWPDSPAQSEPDYDLLDAPLPPREEEAQGEDNQPSTTQNSNAQPSTAQPSAAGEVFSTAGEAPSTAGVAPGTSGMAPQIAGEAPKIAGEAPSTAGVAPQIAGMAPASKINVVYRGPLKAPAGTTLPTNTDALYAFGQTEPSTAAGDHGPTTSLWGRPQSQASFGDIQPPFSAVSTANNLSYGVRASLAAAGQPLPQLSQNAYMTANNQTDFWVRNDPKTSGQAEPAYRLSSTIGDNQSLGGARPASPLIRFPREVELAFREAPPVTTNNTEAQPSAGATLTSPSTAIQDDLTASIPDELPDQIPILGTLPYRYSCAKLLYMTEKARADNLKTLGGGGHTAQELEELDRHVEVLRKEAIALWEAANAGKQGQDVYDMIGLQFLQRFAPK